jgi:hypothetical protein
MTDQAPPSLPKERSNRGDTVTDQKRSNITDTLTPKYKADQADTGKSTGDELGRQSSCSQKETDDDDATSDQAPR